MLIVGTYRTDETVRVPRRLVTELRRGRVASTLELGPLSPDDVAAMLADTAVPAGLVESITRRGQGNPFFVEELAAAALEGDAGVPPALRDALLHRIDQLGDNGRAVARVAAAAGGDVPYGLFAAVLTMTGARLRAALRQAVDHGVLVPDRVAEGYRFRHALLAETVYATLLPGEREDLHARLARALRDDAALAANGSVAGKLAEHWAAAGRPTDALAASVRAAREAESMSGRAEALRHLERVLDLWSRVPSAESLAGTDLPAVLVRAADLAHLTGNGPRAVEFTRRAIGLLDDTGTERASALHERLGTYLLPTGEQEAGLAAFRRAVELAPAGPAPHRVRVLAALGHALMLATRYEESRWSASTRSPSPRRPTTTPRSFAPRMCSPWISATSAMRHGDSRCCGRRARSTPSARLRRTCSVPWSSCPTSCS